MIHDKETKPVAGLNHALFKFPITLRMASRHTLRVIWFISWNPEVFSPMSLMRPVNNAVVENGLQLMGGDSLLSDLQMRLQTESRLRMDLDEKYKWTAEYLRILSFIFMDFRHVIFTERFCCSWRRFEQKTCRKILTKWKSRSSLQSWSSKK